MRIVRLMFTLFLSFAILTVGSAAAAMSVHSPCAMMQLQAEHHDTMAAMVMAEPSMMQSMPQMNCMKIEKTASHHASLCKSGHDCLMHHVQLLYPVSDHIVWTFAADEVLAQQPILQPNSFFPMPDLYGLWRPPRTL